MDESVWCPAVGLGAHPAEHTKRCPFGRLRLFPGKTYFQTRFHILTRIFAQRGGCNLHVLKG